MDEVVVVIVDALLILVVVVVIVLLLSRRRETFSNWAQHGLALVPVRFQTVTFVFDHRLSLVAQLVDRIVSVPRGVVRPTLLPPAQSPSSLDRSF